MIILKSEMDRLRNEILLVNNVTVLFTQYYRPWKANIHFSWMSFFFFLTSGQYRLFGLIRNVSLMLIENKTF